MAHVPMPPFSGRMNIEGTKTKLKESSSYMIQAYIVIGEDLARIIHPSKADAPNS